MTRSTAQPVRAAVYARISKDDDGSALGVGRQVEDCARLAVARGWTPVEMPYVDNDTSAYRKVRRRAYDRLLADVEAGRIDAIVVWDVDRLTRTPRELEDFIDLAERVGIALASVGGEIDLATPQGRLTARIKGNVARHEVEQSGRRIRRAFEGKVARGEPLGRCPYGWRRVVEYDDAGRRSGSRDVLEPAEAAVIRDATARLLGGESLHALTQDLNRRGVPSPAGKAWGATQLRQVVMRPRNAGLLVHRGDVVRRGTWEPIVSETDHHRLVALLTDPARRSNAGAPRYRYLLSGIVRCGRCAERDIGPDGGGTRMKVLVGGGQDAYVCPQCYLRRQRERVDYFVTRVIVRRLARPDALAVLARRVAGDGAVRELTDRRDALRTKLALADDDYGEDKITREQHLRITRRTRPKLDEVEAELRTATGVGDVDLSDLVRPDVAKFWRDVPLERKRAVIDALIEVTILPVGSGARWVTDADAERHVRVEWRS